MVIPKDATVQMKVHLQYADRFHSPSLQIQSGKKTTKGNVPILRHITVDTEQNINNLKHRKENNPSHTTIIAGDSILKHLTSHKMPKDNKKVKVATFPGCTIRDMRDHIKPILRKKPDQLIIHVGTNSLRDSENLPFVTKLLTL